MLPDDYSGDSVAKPHVGTANLKPFPAGVSGNPLGRPPGSLNRSTIVRKWLEMDGVDEDGSRLPNADLITKALIRKAASGDVAAFREAMDSAHGKLSDKTELTGRDGGAIETKGDLSDLDRAMLQQYVKQHQESK